jgi:hypothetical protein
MRTPTWIGVLVAAVVGAAACGPDVNSGDDTGDDCTGDVTRCTGNLFEVCVDGSFELGEACAGSCNPELGCVQCDPDRGNTCSDNQVVTCNPDGSFGAVVQSCGADMVCADGACSNECTADGVDLIYVVDSSYRLLSFDPRRLDGEPFTLIGSLNCPALATPVPGWGGGVTPFSMSVDRTGTAWVHYTSGEIFHVNIANAACQQSGFQRLQQGNPDTWALFGMGFVTDSPGGSTERLFLGGGPDVEPGGMFGVVAPSTLAIQTLGRLPANVENSPEFTGTGNAELFAYFPGASSTIRQLDKATGAVIGSSMNAGSVTGVRAWAFAHWGGKFYIFVTDASGNSTVRRTDRATGTYEGTIRQNLPYVIVGAGVSTCAPVVIP